MPLRVEELDASHLGDASRIFEAAFGRERVNAPILDAFHGTAANVLPKLGGLLDRGYGVAAFEGDRMVGYMAGIRIDEFLSPHRGAYSPEWANGSVEEGAFDIYRAMYRAIGKRWVGDGCVTHAVNLMSHAGGAWDALVWSGFGGICIDAVRPVERMRMASPRGITISQCRDAHKLLPLVEASARHLAEPPSFVPHTEPEKQEELARSLEAPGNIAWVVMSGSEAVGFMRVTPVGNGAAWMVGGERKFAINGAYVLPEHRGNGLASAMLSEVMDWGTGQGFERCSVDFEMTNHEACGFWLRHFTPVCRSIVRRLDARIVNTI